MSRRSTRWSRRWRQRGIAAVPIFVASLKDPASLAVVEEALAALRPAAIITATAFAAAEPARRCSTARACRSSRSSSATTRREAWEGNQRGLAPADLAMHVVLPELDGRILAGAISFKGAGEATTALRASALRPTGRSPTASRRWRGGSRPSCGCRRRRAAERKLAILIPDYPAAPGRTGYAVGLDVPASVLAMLHDLKEAGYAVEGIPESPRELLRLLGWRRRLSLKTTAGRCGGAASRGAPAAVRGGLGGPAGGRRSPSARRASATSPWRWPPIAAAPPTAAPTITTRRCRRAMR